MSNVSPTSLTSAAMFDAFGEPRTRHVRVTLDAINTYDAAKAGSAVPA